MLKQLKLTVEEAQVSDLNFLKTCAKCKKQCYQEKDIVKCRTYAYWIHDNASCHNITLKYGKCCPNSYYTQVSNVKYDNNQGEIITNNRKYNADDDDISEFHNNVNSDNSEECSKTQTVVSESCNTFFNKSNRNKSSGITCNEKYESLPKTIVIPNIVTRTSVEPAMSTDGNKNNVIAGIETVDDNINSVNEIFKDEHLMKFVFHSIEKLEVKPKYFMEFEVFLKSFFKGIV